MKILKITGLMLASILLPLLAWVAFNSIDAADFDAQGLLHAREPLDDADNAYTVLRRLQDMPILDFYGADEAERNRAQRVIGHLAGRAWDETFVHDVMNAHRTALDVVERGLARPHNRMPGPGHVDDEPPSYAHLFSLAKVMALGVRLHQRQGKTDQAIEALHMIYALGEKTKRAQNAYLIGHVMGSSLQGIAAQQAFALGNEGALSPEQSRRLARLIRQTTTYAQDGFTGAVLDEYRYTVLQIDAYPAMTLSERIEDERQSARLWGRPERLFELYFPAYFFHPNETKTLMAREYRALAEQAGRPCTGQSFAPVGTPSLFERLQPNSLGRMHARWESYFHRRCLVSVAHAATALSVALNTYKTRHRHLPDDLEALIPDYIETLPLDAFDGQPLRYSKEHAWLYSVGLDGKDEGGDANGAIGPRMGCAAQGACYTEPTFPIDIRYSAFFPQ